MTDAKATRQNAGDISGADELSGTELVDEAIKRHVDWRGVTLARIRALIKEADPDVVEGVKWRKPSNNMRGVPVWEHDGLICTGETYKTAVKMTFLNGAALNDPSRLFNASLEGGTRRAIDIHEGETINEDAFKELFRTAVAANRPDSSHKKAKR
ncbi:MULTISPECIES: DUF1801 domain-containing protein [unclassified Chelatococcus]|uniref:DUF1801 domain-containing protein n=1 Tax=unclassified Chelatococcus TaxID=2638111 RepID=UPI001BCE3449|nr:MULTISPECIES: DUF1801 domain-containing protein [unclassified Chelatococcus]MBS7698047.1 DUF1801 domain-containing protein [Chelatococcus sp. YT9]MBX3556635.1 DUF1801 domain-containing protein [Chelatococcus sp.]